jgi:hypothetical protein
MELGVPKVLGAPPTTNGVSAPEKLPLIRLLLYDVTFLSGQVLLHSFLCGGKGTWHADVN